jgi:hypothetical protein
MSIDLHKIEAQDDMFSSDSSADIDQPIEQPQPMPIEISEEESIDEVDEQTMIRKRLILKMYLNEFPEKLKSYQKLKNKIDAMDLAKIDITRQEFEIAIGMKNSIGSMTMAMMQSVGMLEVVISKFTPMDATGLAAICNQDKEFQDDLKLVALKYAEKINMRPEVRVGMTLTKNIILLDRVNRTRTAQEPIITTDADADNMPQTNNINELFADI